jgi:hypothetical protein
LAIEICEHSACFSSKTNDEWPTYSVALIFKMAAAANFENDGTLPV